MISGVTAEPGVYVARYGWNRRSGSLIIGAAVFVLLALTVPMSLALRVVTLVFFGGGALVFIASIATRRVALRGDTSGVTPGGSPRRGGAAPPPSDPRGPPSGKPCSGATVCPRAFPCPRGAWPAVKAPARWL